jgi:hypothetical protein
VLTGAVLAASPLSTIANLRVVDAIGGDDWSDEQASVHGPARPGFSSGHDLAERASRLVVVAAVLLTVWLWWRPEPSVGVAVGAVAPSVLLPRCSRGWPHRGGSGVGNRAACRLRLVAPWPS